MSGLMYGAGGRGFEKPAESNLGEYHASAPLRCDANDADRGLLTNDDRLGR